MECAVPSTQVQELLLQSLEQERGGVKVYQSALKCALRDDLRSEWSEYLAQTTKHVRVLTDVCSELGIDAGTQTPGTRILHELGGALVRAIESAHAAGNPPAAQIVACECVVLAETKDHADWELIGLLAKETEGDVGQLLLAAYEQIEDEEDEHLYHTKGWCRELWAETLGLEARLPPPEESRDVRSATEAEKAKSARKTG
jgi:hypothetical protein